MMVIDCHEIYHGMVSICCIDHDPRVVETTSLGSEGPQTRVHDALDVDWGRSSDKTKMTVLNVNFVYSRNSKTDNNAKHATESCKRSKSMNKIMQNIERKGLRKWKPN